ncbi:MAG: NifU family protein [Candidatus Eisenbacteria bacterium]
MSHAAESTPVPTIAPTRLGLSLAVQEVLEEIRPAIQMDGGDVEFVGVDEAGRVTVRLLGACTGCSMSQLTLKQGIENLLLMRIPGVTSVDAAIEEPA